MSKPGVLVWRYLFESGDKKRLAKQVQDLSDLRIRRDLMRAISNVVCGKEDTGKPYESYLRDPSLLVAAPLPPVFMVTSEEDLIRKESLKLDGLLTAAGYEHELLDFSKGAERQLIHVFSVSFPTYPESREVFARMDEFFKVHEGVPRCTRSTLPGAFTMALNRTNVS